MAKMGDNTYGDVYAEIYDALFQDRDDLDLVSQALATLAGEGPVLEFGIGTGRVALPLAQRGLKVYGIDNSEAMLCKLREKSGADQIIAVLGDCTKDQVVLEGSFSMIYIAFSTLFLFESQEAQVQCFQNASRHLRQGGVFVVEGFVHDRGRWPHLHECVTTRIDENAVGLRVALLDPVNQLIKMQQVELTPAGVKFRPNRLRFIYPPEMDLMARLAGFRLRERWSDWSGALFTANSATQIAIYEKVGEDKENIPMTQTNTNTNFLEIIYTDAFAEAYDDLFADRENLDLISQTLSKLAGDGAGPVLEFGIGTGRLAVPLARRGVTVYGIDNSGPMLRKLREKPESSQIVSVLGDCTKDRVKVDGDGDGEGFFSMVFIAFSTLFALRSQEAQVQCFLNAARHLGKGGVFLVEGFNHDRTRWQHGQEATTLNISENCVSVRFGLLDPVTQLIKLQYIDFTPAGIKFRPNLLRFVYPSEMDLMARLAGFKLRERWSNWSGTPFGADSASQIAIYEKMVD